MRVAFFEAASGDTDKAGLGAEFVQRVGTDVTHARTQTAHELEDDIC